MVDQKRIRKKFHDLWKDNTCYMGRFWLSGAVLLALSFTFLFFGPLEIVAFSGDSLVFTYRDVLPILLVLLLMGVALTPLLALLRGRIFHYTICVLVAITLGGWLQALLLNGSHSRRTRLRGGRVIKINHITFLHKIFQISER